VSPRPRFLLTFLAWSSGLSGGDRHLLEVAARWREHVDVEVLAPPEAGAVLGDHLGDVRVHALGSARGTRSAPGAMLAFEYVKRAFTVTARRFPHFDVVATASHFLPDAAALMSVTRRGGLGVSYVYHLVANRPGLGPRTLWSKGDEGLALSILRRYATVVFVSNAATEAALAARAFDPVRTAVGVDVASFPHVVPTQQPPHGAFVARMAPTKGVTDAIEAWAQVRQSVPEAQLVMVGTGRERAHGMRLAERLSVAGAVDWPGFVSEDAKRRVLDQSRVLLAPSYEEGWGIAVCEALASGVPVVAYRHPVLDELFDGAYLAATPGDIGGLARLAVRVLTDDALADDFSARGRATAARYDVTRVAEHELESILRAKCTS
jgi:glycosyltransferase involved in cell wall biosynthesis